MSALDKAEFYPNIVVGEAYVHLVFAPVSAPTHLSGVGNRTLHVRPAQEAKVMRLAKAESLRLVRRSEGVQTEREEPFPYLVWHGSGGPMDDD